MSAPLILATNSIKDTGYSVDNSVRLDGTDDHFSRTTTQAGTSNKAFTFSCWIKRSKRNTDVPRLLHFGGSGASPTHYISVRFRDDQNGRLSFYTEAGGGGFQLNTNALFRDEAAWMHVVVAVNSAATEEIDRQKMYVNGTQITSFSSTTAMSFNSDLGFNDSGEVIYLFRKQEDSDHFPGYAAEVAFIDGQQLTPTSFGEFDSDSPNIWRPIDFKDDVTFGTNGFYLEFKDSSALGTDSSGNSNNFNYNFGAVNQSTDTCTNNFATLNPLDVATSGTSTFAEGNLKMTTDKQSRTTFGASSGKWYVEAKYVNNTAANGIAQMDGSNTFNTNSIVLFGSSNGTISVSGSDTDTNVGAGTAIADNSIIMFAMDLDNNRLYLGKNGSWWTSGSGFVSSSLDSFKTITRVTGDTFGFKCSNYSGTGTTEWNFGSPPYTISSGNADGEGFGNFEYAVPSGYFALCTKNLSEYG